MNLKETIRKVLRESSIPLKYRRRLVPVDIKKVIDEYLSENVNFFLNNEKTMGNPEIERRANWIIQDTKNKLFTGMYFGDWSTENYESFHYELENYLMDNYGDYVRKELKQAYKTYLKNLNDNAKKFMDSLDENETELTERCWKGYTQKGMKTMFGKRYPNCVKKKK